MSIGRARATLAGARCVCVLSTVLRTFRSRRRPRGPLRSRISARTGPAETDTEQPVSLQSRIALAEPYRMDGDPVSSGHEQKLTSIELDRPCSRVGCGRPATVSAMLATGWFFVCDAHKESLWPSPAPPAVTHTGQPT